MVHARAAVSDPCPTDLALATMHEEKHPPPSNMVRAGGHNRQQLPCNLPSSRQAVKSCHATCRYLYPATGSGGEGLPCNPKVASSASSAFESDVVMNPALFLFYAAQRLAFMQSKKKEIPNPSSDQTYILIYNLRSNDDKSNIYILICKGDNSQSKFVEQIWI